ncbi:MAG TPA: threonine/serine dehydratase [Woeseiaceae bacterium]|nr:threonine/serine dehydratase [Woeseiaceae bacterium]
MNRLSPATAGALAAAERIAPHIRRTPLDYSPCFSERTGANVYLKLENLQHTGSFKLRGAFNKLLSLSGEQRAAGCIAASSGNHGAALAFAMSKLGVHGTIYVPEATSSVKVDAIRRAGAEVCFFGRDGLETEKHARARADEEGKTYLSPYNDAAVIAGQATCGVEIAEDLPGLDAVFIAVGGGGLVAGAGGYLKSFKPAIEVVSCQPAASAVMTRSIEAGCILDLPSEPTLSDGTAGGIEQGAITFELCRSTIDEYVLVSEAQIAEAMRAFIDGHHMLLEGAAGVALAGLLVAGDRYAGRDVAVIVCGGNISRETLRTVI